MRTGAFARNGLFKSLHKKRKRKPVIIVETLAEMESFGGGSAKSLAAAFTHTL